MISLYRLFRTRLSYPISWVLLLGFHFFIFQIDRVLANGDSTQAWLFAVQSFEMDFVIEMSATRPPILILGSVLGLIGAVSLVNVGIAGFRNIRWVAWRFAFQRVGRIWFGLALIVTVLLSLNPEVLGFGLFDDSNGVIQHIIPLFMALQAASIFAPDDEPSLEIQLAAKRPLSWLVVERLLVIFIGYFGIVLITIAILSLRDANFDVFGVLVLWLPSALFLTGLAMFITMRSRLVIFGVIMIGFLWIIFNLFGDLLLPGGQFPFPLNLVQPFLWPINVHATPDTFALVSDFWINRFFLTGAGLTLMFLAVREVRDEESVLLNLSVKQRRKQRKNRIIGQVDTKLNAFLKVQPIPVEVNQIMQIWTIARYEMKMQWRRRALKVFTLTLLLINTFIVFFLSDATSAGLPESINGMLSQNGMIAYGLLLVLYLTGPLVTVSVFMYPLVVAEVIPLDKQYRVDELISAVPLRQGTYLLGKILGAWLAGLTTFGLVLLLLAAGWYLKIGAYSAMFLVNLIVVTFIFMICNSVLAVMIGATQKSRVRALVAVIIVLVISLIVAGQVESPIIDAFFPNQAELFTIYIFESMNSLAVSPPVIPDLNLFQSPLADLLFAGIAQAMLISLFVWVYLRRKEAVL